jgi:hypothetical protein
MIVQNNLISDVQLVILQTLNFISKEAEAELCQAQESIAYT